MTDEEDEFLKFLEKEARRIDHQNTASDLVLFGMGFIISLALAVYSFVTSSAEVVVAIKVILGFLTTLACMVSIIFFAGFMNKIRHLRTFK